MAKLNQKQISELLFEEQASGEAIVEPLLGLFESQLSIRIFKMRFLQYEKRYSDLAGLAHQTKTSARNLGLETTYEICLRLETVSKEATPEKLPEIITEIEQMAQQEIFLLKNYLKQKTLKAA